MNRALLLGLALWAAPLAAAERITAFHSDITVRPDGTMVVVDHGRRFIGQQVDATVTTVLQTTAGRMIFARPRDDEGAAR